MDRFFVDQDLQRVSLDYAAKESAGVRGIAIQYQTGDGTAAARDEIGEKVNRSGGLC